MTMTDRNPVSHLMDGMVKCRHCGTPLETDGESLNETPKYVCTAKNDGCNTPDLEAEPFNRLVARRAIHAFLNPQNTGKVFTIIHDEAMSEGNENLRAALDLQQTTPEPDDEPPPHGEDREPTFIGLLHGQEIANELPNSFGFIVLTGPAPRKVEEYSLNLDTYLRPSNIHTTKAIMETLISEILVGPDSATIRYSLPVHPGGWPEARTSEEVPTS